MTNQGTAFTSQDFEDHCSINKVNHWKITATLARVNGQVERMNAIAVSVLAKLAIDDPSKWYKHVDRVQRPINSTYQRSVNTTLFDLMMGVRMRNVEDLKVIQVLEEAIKEI